MLPGKQSFVLLPGVFPLYDSDTYATVKVRNLSSEGGHLICLLRVVT